MVEGAREHNLHDVDAEFPLGRLVAVTGVSGSGKSTLVNDILLRSLAKQVHRAKTLPGQHRTITGVSNVDKVVEVDQAPIGRTPRSNPATYTGVFDHIRQAVQPDPGGQGPRLPARAVLLQREGRPVRGLFGGRHHPDRDALPARHLRALRGVPRGPVQPRHPGGHLPGQDHRRRARPVLRGGPRASSPTSRPSPGTSRPWSTWASGYIRLGQPAPTLSGGEAQRVKLASELSRRSTGHTLYVLDEPTTGLHFDDVRKLLDVLSRLVDQGNTVIVIEHNLDVIKSADWIIDLGPEGGDRGGSIVAVGTPEEVAAAPGSYTGEVLAPLLGIKRGPTRWCRRRRHGPRPRPVHIPVHVPVQAQEKAEAARPKPRGTRATTTVAQKRVAKKRGQERRPRVPARPRPSRAGGRHRLTRVRRRPRLGPSVNEAVRAVSQSGGQALRPWPACAPGRPGPRRPSPRPR